MSCPSVLVVKSDSCKGCKFYRTLGVFEVRLFKLGAFNIEILYLLIVQRVLWSGDSMKRSKGVTIKSSSTALEDLLFQFPQKNLSFIFCKHFTFKTILIFFAISNHFLLQPSHSARIAFISLCSFEILYQNFSCIGTA